MILIRVAILIFYLITAHGDTSNVCQGKKCVEAARELKKNMNVYADPCEDFYEFACGGYLNRTRIPKNTAGVNSLRSIQLSTLQQIKHLLTEATDEHEIYPFRITKQLFRECMDEDKILQLGFAPILEKVNELGGWPMLVDHWDDSNFSWIQMIAKARKLGFFSDYILSYHIESDFTDTRYRTIYVGPPTLGISSENLRRGARDSKVKFYYKLMVNIARKLGASMQKARLQSSSILQFEVKIAQIYPTMINTIEDLQKTLLSTNTSHAQKTFPYIDWKTYLQNMINPSNTLSDSDKFIIYFPQFIKQMENILQTTSKRTLANYIAWRVTFSSLGSYMIVTDQTTLPRWKNCLAVTAGRFDVALGAMYVKRFFKNEKEEVSKIFFAVRNQIKQTLSNSQWLDNITRQHALEKARNIIAHVAYPDEFTDDKKLEEFYQHLHLEPGQYYENLLTIDKHIMNFTNSLLTQPVKRDDWLHYSNPIIVNAFYVVTENAIRIPAAILQKNVYTTGRPNYMNYASIGFILAHEMSHAFDTQGKSFDQDGNMKNWWSPQTNNLFLEKVQCLVDQYDKYIIKETNDYVNGTLTLGENIADNEGITHAYNAYQSWIKEHGAEPKLPGLEYSPEQLFWISAANTWCSKYRRMHYKWRIPRDVHAPERFRVIGPLSNQPDFAKAFDCAVGTPMNPSKKCSIWS